MVLCGTQCTRGDIRQDKEVEVVRTKNRMDPDVDEHPIYAGYRDVSLNLRFRSEEAMMLGLDGHVCELRLVLMSVISLYQVLGRGVLF